MKTCSKCQDLKSLSKFDKHKGTKDGYQYFCKGCGKIYRQDTRNRRAEVQRSYFQKPEIREKSRQYQNKWYHENRSGKINYRLSDAISSGIYLSLKTNKGGIKWQNLLRFSLNDLKKHLESQFQSGMSWDNYGEWHIDHIKPKSWFNYSSYSDNEFKECWSLNNLQPKWAKENLSKSNRFIG